MNIQAKAPKRAMSIRRALEWAFGDELAVIESDELTESAGSARIGFDPIQVMIERGALGCKVDGGGRSHPAWDAEIIASAVGNLPEEWGGKRMAHQIAEMARAGVTPDHMTDAKPRCVPVEWRNNKHGKYARIEIYRTIETVHRGRRTKRHEEWCPVTYSPTQGQIAAARRNYLAWYGALLWVRGELASLGILSRIEITTAMPPMQPWITHN